MTILCIFCLDSPMASKFREIWIPRLFILSLLPAFVMLLALIFYPTSELAKCPFLVHKQPLQVSNPSTDLSISIQGHIFAINNTLVFSQPIDTHNGTRLVFLGIVLDVTSGQVFYGGPDGAYHNLTKDGVDTTRALLMSSLDPKNLNDDLDDFGSITLRDRLVQWLPFFLNKYPQLGVASGKFFNLSGQPSKLWRDIVDALSADSSTNDSSIPSTDDCVVNGDSVSCFASNHRPKIIRHRGTSRCVCGIEEELFASKSPLFTVVHFENCNDESTVCWPKIYEL